MMNLAEYRKTNTILADFLPWAALAAPGVILNKDGSLQRTARFRGPDLDSATASELVGASARLNNALRRLGSGWAVFVEAQRNEAVGYPASNFPDPASSLVEFERRAQFEEAGAHYESAYYLTFLYLPPAEQASRAEGWLYENRAREEGADTREVLRGFIDRTNRVLHLVEGFVPEAAWLPDADTLTYLHSTVSTKRHPVRVPEVPMHLDAILTDEPLTGGLEPRLGRAHLRVLTVMGFPSATYPGLLDELNRLPFPYRWDDAGDLPGQDRRDQAADQDTPAVVRQAEVDRRHPQGDHDQRGVRPVGHGRPQQGFGRRRRPGRARLRHDRPGLRYRDRDGLGR